VLNLIRQHGPISRAQVAKKAEMTRATVSDIVSGLLNEGAIFEGKLEVSTDVGRKGILLHYNADAGYGVAIDLGGTKISLAIFNADAELAEEKSLQTFRVQTSPEFIALLIASIREFIRESSRDPDALQVIGIGTPGIIDVKNGIVIEGSPNLPEWENLNLSEQIGQAFDVPVVVENDVRAALVGEVWRGQCQHVRNAALITISTGVGSALLLEGQIIRGANNAAGEIGYMLFNREHLSQDWGNKGCYETIVSGSGLLERARSLHTEHAAEWESARDIFDRARAGDPVAVGLLDEFIDYLSIGMINLVFTLNPERIVLMGGLTESADYFLDRVNANIRKHSLSHMNAEVSVTELKGRAPLYGLSLLAMNAIQPSIRYLEHINLN
jgi:glucokinase-like ROK family protein